MTTGVYPSEAADTMGGMLELCMRYEKDQAAISTHCRKGGRGTVTKRANSAPVGQSDILALGLPVAPVLWGSG